jgi:hypothetical protein
VVLGLKRRFGLGCRQLGNWSLADNFRLARYSGAAANVLEPEPADPPRYLISARITGNMYVISSRAEPHYAAQ